MDLNKVTLIGNMVRDPESRSLRTGAHITRFSLATNYAWQDAKTKAKKESVDFHNVIAWGSLANIAERILCKGTHVTIDGKLISRNYADKQGIKRTSTEIMANELMVLHGINKVA